MLFSILLLAASAAAGPLSRRANGATKAFHSRNTLVGMEIHDSCNATEVRQLRKAFAETYELVTTARDYILEHGSNDDVYKTYFGSAPPYAVVGAYESVAHENKEGVLFRCDNVDGNCDMDGWAGHWRGDNATQETVICPLSYEIKHSNDKLCAFGYTVASQSTNWLFSSDILHRLSHIPSVSHGALDHYADGYAGSIELAKSNDTWTPYNTHTLQFFALDVYARVVSIPGTGCTGEAPEEEEEEEDATTTSTTGASEATSTQDCHTHADGEVHCV